MTSKPATQCFLLGEMRDSKIYIPARVIIGGRVLVVLWEAVKVTCVDC